jgi:hypothetical protein
MLSGPERLGGSVIVRPIVGIVLALTAVTSSVVGVRSIAFSVQDIGTADASVHSTGHDALWLSHLWVDGRKGPSDVAALAAEIRQTGITDLFVHVGPLRSGGSLDPALRPRSQWLIAAVHAALPGVRILAWVGDTVPPTGSLDLQDARTRSHIVGAIRALLTEGFDGIHYDFEPVGDGDPGFLTLLTQSKAVTDATGKRLSVSAEQVEPVEFSRWLMEAAVGHGTWWSSSYLHQVATRVDQVAVMSYDTALWSPSAYAGFVRDQTRVALSAVPGGTGLLIGVPAYHSRSLVHDDAAETVRAAIRGVQLAASGVDLSGREFGIAVYMDYTATRTDWAAYNMTWAHAIMPTGSHYPWKAS